MAVSTGRARLQAGRQHGLSEATIKPGLFGATGTPDGVRIVWHYVASDETPHLSTISYRVINAAVAYDDVIDVRAGRSGATSGTSASRTSPPTSGTAQLDPEQPDLPRLRAPAAIGRGDDHAGTGDRDAAGLRRARRSVRRDEGDGPPPARSGRQRRQPRRGHGIARRSPPPRRSATEDFNSTWNRTKRFVAHHAELLALLIAAVLLAVARVAAAALAGAPDLDRRSTSRSRPTTPPGSRLRPRQRG